MTLSSLVRKSIRRFRGLKEWKISVARTALYQGQCSINPDKPEAIIYGFPDCPELSDYALHEVLHIAFRAAVRSGMDGEELFVQDICSLVRNRIAAEWRAIADNCEQRSQWWQMTQRPSLAREYAKQVRQGEAGL